MMRGKMRGKKILGMLSICAALVIGGNLDARAEQVTNSASCGYSESYNNSYSDSYSESYNDSINYIYIPEIYVNEVANSDKAEETSTVTLNVKYNQTEARKMLDLVNKFRTGSEAWAWNKDNTQKVYYTGLKKLEYDYTLEKVAMQRAAEIAMSFDHVRPNGGKAFDLMEEYGFIWYGAGENIAAGYNSYTTAESVFIDWKEENQPYSGQGHRRNMLSATFTKVGIAGVRYNNSYYWVQVFGYPKSEPANNATTACDSNKNVDIEILKSNILSSEVSLDKTSIKMKVDDSVALPVPTAKITVKGTWPSGFFLVAPKCKWTYSGSNACISSGKLVAKSGGTGCLEATILGTKYTVNVTIEDKKIVIASPSYEYTGKAIKPGVTVKDGKGNTIPATNYTVAYSNNTNVGTATIKVTFKSGSNYSGTLSKTYKIVPKKVSISSTTNATKGVVVKWAKCASAEGYYIYRSTNGGSYTKIATITKNTTLSYTDTKATTNGTKYQYKIASFKKIGTTEYKSSYSAVKTILRLSTPTITSASNTGAGKITVKWSKNPKATGYEIRYVTGTTTKTVNVTNASTVSKVLSSLKKGSTYKITVRSYKKGTSTTYYSAWSAAKSVKVNK